MILTGAGRAFSAGFDLKAEAAEGAISVEEWAERFQDDWNIFLRIWKSAKPYVAVVHGYNLGGALELSLLADVTLASSLGPVRASRDPPRRRSGGDDASLGRGHEGSEVADADRPAGSTPTAPSSWVSSPRSSTTRSWRAVRCEIAAELASIPAVALKFTKLALNRTYERMGFLSAVDENYTISTVMNATAAYREQEAERQQMPLKEFLRKARQRARRKWSLSSCELSRAAVNDQGHNQGEKVQMEPTQSGGMDRRSFLVRSGSAVAGIGLLSIGGGVLEGCSNNVGADDHDHDQAEADEAGAPGELHQQRRVRGLLLRREEGLLRQVRPGRRHRLGRRDDGPTSGGGKRRGPDRCRLGDLRHDHRGIRRACRTSASVPASSRTPAA